MKGRPGLAGLALALTVCACLSACGAAAAVAPPAPQPPVVPGQATAGPDLNGIQLPDVVMPLIKGGIARPSPKNTPGEVTTSDATITCALGQHAAGPAIPAAVQTEVYDQYGYTTQKEQMRHFLNLLVPWNLGGAVTAKNIWPVSIKGIGYYQKVETDHILRDLVCRRTITLAQAQQALEGNWYSAWLRYVVLAGHI